MVYEEFLLRWVVPAAACVWLLRSGFKHRLFRAYPLIFASVLARLMLLKPANWVVALWFGRGSFAYSYFYYGTGAALVVLETVALLGILRVFGRFSLRRDWHLVVAPAALLTGGLVGFPEVWLYVRFHNTLLVVECYLAMVACLRMAVRSDVDLGWNLKGTLLGFSIPTTLNALLIIAFNTGPLISYESVAAWVLRAETLRYVALAVAMSEFAPPRGRVNWVLAPSGSSGRD